jgi:hypothetical protein
MNHELCERPLNPSTSIYSVRRFNPYRCSLNSIGTGPLGRKLTSPLRGGLRGRSNFGFRISNSLCSLILCFEYAAALQQSKLTLWPKRAKRFSAHLFPQTYKAAPPSLHQRRIANPAKRGPCNLTT